MFLFLFWCSVLCFFLVFFLLLHDVGWETVSAGVKSIEKRRCKRVSMQPSRGSTYHTVCKCKCNIHPYWRGSLQGCDRQHFLFHSRKPTRNCNALVCDSSQVDASPFDNGLLFAVARLGVFWGESGQKSKQKRGKGHRVKEVTDSLPKNWRTKLRRHERQKQKNADEKNDAYYVIPPYQQSPLFFLLCPTAQETSPQL